MKKDQSMAEYLFHQGTNYRAYEYMGVHWENGAVFFRVWAPHADRVLVVGDFNAWSDRDEMKRITEAGIWEVALPTDRVRVGDRYKFKICGCGKTLWKADPYGVQTEAPPATATVIADPEAYTWRDGGWMAYRKRVAHHSYEMPMNVYELHLGSWKRKTDGSYYSYSELASELATYVKQMGYTHVELMPVMEHPFNGSWGYQICSYYAPTARFGSPSDFKGFVDTMHEAGVGVILDWVPAHFPKDEHGLIDFDGCPLYEYSDPQRQEHAGWGTRRFDVGKREVECFLISNAMFWIEQYHVDGLRVDAVASMLYLDYGKAPGEWTPNEQGDHRCLEAISFFRRLNGCVKKQAPDVLMIAEESTAWPHVTGNDKDSLGFDLKWNMGWMNDTLDYVAMDPIYRKYHHGKMTFSMTYAFSEHFVLPISHDEVVHLKRSLLDKNPGDYWQKFAGVRALLGYMMTHPGKKLLFMGGEIGQFREWSWDSSVEWFLLDYEAHAKLQHFVATLNHLYLASPELWQLEDSWDGFQWIDPNNRDQSILSYRRIDLKGNELIAVINFTPVARENFLIGVPVSGIYEEVLNSDRVCFGGSGVVNSGALRTVGQAFHGQPDALSLRIPPLGISILKCRKRLKKSV